VQLKATKLVVIKVFRFKTIVELRDIKTGSTLDFATLELIVNNVNDNAPQIKTIILESAKRQDQNGKKLF